MQTCNWSGCLWGKGHEGPHEIEVEIGGVKKTKFIGTRGQIAAWKRGQALSREEVVVEPAPRRFRFRKAKPT